MRKESAALSTTFNRPRGMKYTDMAIYIDEHMREIAVPNANPEVESLIYQYIYHILYALSCKAGYFKNFDDYDTFACYGAAEIFFSIRKKLMNEGKEVRGKTIIPVKSSLNFIKATMFPLKINYQRENFMQVLDPEIHENANQFAENIREDIQSQYKSEILEYLMETSDRIPALANSIIDATPFKSDLGMRKKLQISILLTFLNDITIPNKLKRKLDSKVEKDRNQKILDKMLVAYETNADNVILWHLDSGYKNYVRILTRRLKRYLGSDFGINVHRDDLMDNIVDSIINTAYDSATTAEDME